MMHGQKNIKKFLTTFTVHFKLWNLALHTQSPE